MSRRIAFITYDLSNNPRDVYFTNGKELDRMHGLDTYDYGARQYDPVLCRWDRMDPLCEKYYGVSPYVYCENNPIVRIDKDGRFWDTALDLFFVACDLVEAGYQYVTQGKIDTTTKAALTADALAVVLPGVTGAGLTVRGGAKVAKETVNVSKATEKIQQAEKTTNKMEKLREKAEIDQEAHRQIEKELHDAFGARTEVTIPLSEDEYIRKDAIMPDGRCVIIKPDTKSGHKAAKSRVKLMQGYGCDTHIIYYNPNNPAYLPTSPTYIGPKMK